ncbi:MAG: DUF3352 domain-containing protein [Chloroflexi bacterium]|nr:DUF3352 domain-containing protein [Chloroflexota bacterium]
MDEMDQGSELGAAPAAPPAEAVEPPADAGAATAPVTAPAAGVEAPSAPAKRPTGLARWGVALIALAVAVGVVSVAAAILAAGGSSSTVQGWLPKDTVAYLEVRADLPGDQRTNVGNLLAKFPGFADQSTLDAKIDEALDRMLEGSGVSWTKDVKPWLGGEVGYAVTTAAFAAARAEGLGSGALGGMAPATMPEDGFVALVSVKDAAAASAWVGSKLGGTQSTEAYAGGDLTVVSGGAADGAAFAVRGSVLLLGPQKAVKAALDTGGKSAVASSASFAAARKTAPSAYLGYGFIDLKAFVDAALAAAGDQSSTVPQACLDSIVAGIPAWAAGSARAEDAALVFEASSAATGTAGAAGPSAIASHLPATTVAAVEVRDFGPGLVDGLARLKDQLACDPSAAATVEQVEEALMALGGAEALVGWAGDAALAVEYNGGTFGGGFATVVTDEAAAGRTLDQVRSLVALGGSSAGISVHEESFGSGTLLVVDVPSSVGAEVPQIAATVQGGVFVVGTIDFVKSVVGVVANSSLATTVAYTRAMSAAGGDGVSDVYVDLAGIRRAVEATMPAAEKARYETEVKPYIEPFEAFASVAKGPGTSAVSRAVITFTK